MARALLFALTCAAAASAARYVDYSGVKMPAYGAGDYDAPREPAAAPQSDDYLGHSPDAPASLDYKYEEEPRLNTEKPTKDSDEAEAWRKPGRKQRGLVRPPTDIVAEAVHKYEREEEDVPKFRMSHRFPKHRSRLKSDVQPRDEEPPPQPRRAVKYSRDRKDDISDIDSKDYFHVDKDDFPDDKSKEFEDDVKFVTRRGNRRKPRDKYIKRKSNDLESGYEDLEQEDNLRRMRPSERHVERTHAPHPARALERERFRPLLEDEEVDAIKQPPGKSKGKPYEDYDDYYDMKRVNNIKSKLPALLRRPTVSVTPTTGASVAERELKAALGAIGSRRMRKESGVALPVPLPPPLLAPPRSGLPIFPPGAVSLDTNKQWNDFIAANNTQRLQFSIYVTFLALINCLQIYEYSNILVTTILTLRIVNSSPSLHHTDEFINWVSNGVPLLIQVP